MQNIKLTEREYRLYDFLLSVGDKWVTQREIAFAMPDVFPYSGEESGFHDSACRRAITYSIRKLNNSGEIHKVIISSSRGIKIADEEEWRTFIEHQYISVFKRLKRLRIKEQKGKLHGQYFYVYETEKDVIDAFLSASGE